MRSDNDNNEEAVLRLDHYPFFRHKIIADQVCCGLLIACYDLVRFFQCATKSVMAIVTSDPSIAMIAVAKKTQVFDFYNPFGYSVINVLFHHYS